MLHKLYGKVKSRSMREWEAEMGAENLPNRCEKTGQAPLFNAAIAIIALFSVCSVGPFLEPPEALTASGWSNASHHSPYDFRREGKAVENTLRAGR